MKLIRVKTRGFEGFTLCRVVYQTHNRDWVKWQVNSNLCYIINNVDFRTGVCALKQVRIMTTQKAGIDWLYPRWVEVTQGGLVTISITIEDIERNWNDYNNINA